MPSRLSSRTNRAEAALLQIAMRVEDHRRLASGDPTQGLPQGRHIWWQSDFLRHGNAIVDLVAVAENFCSSRLLDCRPQVQEQEVFSWDRRKKAWKKYASVDLETVTLFWDNLYGFIEARNSLQHGLGSLTDSQLSEKRRGDVLRCIKTAGLALVGDRISVDFSSVVECRRVCEEFVFGLDVQAP